MMESDEDLRTMEEDLEGGEIHVVAKADDDPGSCVGDVDGDGLIGEGGAARFFSGKL